MKTQQFDAIVYSSASENQVLADLTRLLRESTLPEDELLANLGIFLTSKTLARILFFQHIYQLIVDTHGVIIEFGTRWGQTVSVLSALRGIYEPFNRHRKIIGFDTFEGFQGLGDKDGVRCGCADGSYSVSPGYESVLARVLAAQEALNPISHIAKYELVKGDVRRTAPEYFERHPESVVSLAVFDLDIHEPTRAALEAVKPRLFKGSVLVFDELCDEVFPGETLAVMDVFGLDTLRLKRLPIASRLSYAVIE